jgi:hypothetical protein
MKGSSALLVASLPSRISIEAVISPTRVLVSVRSTAARHERARCAVHFARDLQIRLEMAF